MLSKADFFQFLNLESFYKHRIREYNLDEKRHTRKSFGNNPTGLYEFVLPQCLLNCFVAQYFSSSIRVVCITAALTSLLFVLDIPACG